jgi:lipopolysaccharide/colanic/teichoic acid biosynthesis glycosyltransferase
MTSLCAIEAREEASFERRIARGVETIDHWSRLPNVKIILLTSITLLTSQAK